MLQVFAVIVFICFVISYNVVRLCCGDEDEKDILEDNDDNWDSDNIDVADSGSGDPN